MQVGTRSNGWSYQLQESFEPDIFTCLPFVWSAYPIQPKTDERTYWASLQRARRLVHTSICTWLPYYRTSHRANVSLCPLDVVWKASAHRYATRNELHHHRKSTRTACILFTHVCWPICARSAAHGLDHIIQLWNRAELCAAYCALRIYASYSLPPWPHPPSMALVARSLRLTASRST